MAIANFEISYCTSSVSLLNRFFLQQCGPDQVRFGTVLALSYPGDCCRVQAQFWSGFIFQT